MNKDNLRKATAALRSDRYRQIQGAARSDEGYCAYGVMADITGLGQWLESASHEGFYHYITPTADDLDQWYDETGGFQKWMYLHDEDGKPASIVELNDDYGYDFHQIAALMEKEFEL